MVVKLMEFFDRRVGGQETFGRKLCGVGRPSHNRAAETAATTALASVGRGEVSIKKYVFAKRTQLKNSYVF